MSKLDSSDQKSLDRVWLSLRGCTLPGAPGMVWLFWKDEAGSEDRCHLPRFGVLLEESGCGIWLISHFHWEGSWG